MAEIKIEKKTPIWPWIIVILVVLAVVAYLIYDNDTNDNAIYDNDMNSESMDTISNNYDESYGTAAPYTMDSTTLVNEFTNSISDTSRIGTDSLYTKTAIVNLAKVVTMKADQLNLESSTALENLKTYSNQTNEINNNSVADNGSEIDVDFKTASSDIVTVLETIQTNNYPSLQDEVSELKQTSNKIETNIATKEQQNTLQTFFTKAKEVVNNMNT